MSESENKETKPKFDFYRLKELCKSEVLQIGELHNHTICGYSRESLKRMVEKPWNHTNKLISVMKFLYFHSGYFRKIIQYYVNLAKTECWNIDTDILTCNKNKIKKTKIKKDFFEYSREVGSYDLENELTKILFSVFMYDAYFGYIVETSDGKVIFPFQPEECIITGYVNGMPSFAVKRTFSRNKRAKIYPDEVQRIFDEAEETGELKSGYVQMPFEKTICIKYNDGFDYIYPPFAFIIKEILDIEDFKDIEKTKAENEVYKFLAMKIPTDQNGVPTMSEPDVTPYYELALSVLARSIGAIPTPFDVKPIEFSTNTTNNINNVKNAIDEMYSELGVSQSLLSGASSGSELKTSIEVDASEVYRILKQVAKAVNFHCRLKLTNSNDYRFTLRYLNVTAFNQNDKLDELLKMAQASCPVKSELMAVAGCNPLKMLGNAYMENEIFELADSWKPMKTAYTQSAEDSENNGRPAMDESEISAITQNTHDNEGNDKDNRG